ncbi:DUF2489 domain-containing protein [Sessilibacter sp. MAH4]
MLYLLILGIVIIAVLAGVAGYYLWQLKKQKEYLAQVEAEQQKTYEDQRKRMNNSIQRIAQGLLADQLTLTEAALRIRAMMNGLGVSEEDKTEFKAFFLLAEKTEHIPILEEWKELEKTKKREYEKQRLAHEKEFGDFVRDAAEKIMGKNF